MSILSNITGPASRYKHDHPPVRNVNELAKSRQSAGQVIADKVAAVVGSWPFIIAQSVVLVVWMTLNVLLVVRASAPGGLKAWDPYPFILLNLVLSFQAAYTGPVVMMSQNRQAERDRLAAEADYECNVKAEKELQVVLQQLEHQEQLTARLLERLKHVETTVARPMDR